MHADLLFKGQTNIINDNSKTVNTRESYNKVYVNKSAHKKVGNNIKN